jgi:hypothetical protein
VRPKKFEENKEQPQTVQEESGLERQEHAARRIRVIAGTVREPGLPHKRKIKKEIKGR